MSLAIEAQQHLVLYAEQFPAKAPELSDLYWFVGGDQLAFDRKNPRGHVTASALILDPIKSCVLMIHHKVHDKWLSPGGHVDKTDSSLWFTAYREALEETGVHIQYPIDWLKQTGGVAPIDVDSHLIAARPEKDEGAHTHHDFLYLGLADSTRPMVPDRNEIIDLKWVSLADYKGLGGVRAQRVIEALGRITKQ